MATLRFSDEFTRDLARIAIHLASHEVHDLSARFDSIVEALQVLTRHPLIGRKANRGQRELVIGRAARGYVARYLYDEREDEVLMLGLRAQREAGFSDD